MNNVKKSVWKWISMFSSKPYPVGDRIDEVDDFGFNTLRDAFEVMPFEAGDLRIGQFFLIRVDDGVIVERLEPMEINRILKLEAL